MHVREPFAAFLEDVTERLAGTEIALQGSADTMFRQARDVRFSPDKRPHSVSVTGLLTQSGASARAVGWRTSSSMPTAGGSAAACTSPQQRTSNRYAVESSTNPKSSTGCSRC